MRKVAFLLCLIVSNQLVAQVKSEAYDSLTMAPYFGYFAGLKDRDSLTIQQISGLGPLLCSGSDLEVIGFTLSGWGTCLGGNGIQWRQVIGNRLTKQDLEFIRLYQPGSFLSFENIRVTNKLGRVYFIRLFHIKIKG